MNKNVLNNYLFNDFNLHFNFQLLIIGKKIFKLMIEKKMLILNYFLLKLMNKL